MDKDEGRVEATDLVTYLHQGLRFFFSLPL